ncbi:preprotein translocase subunit SecA [Anaerotruncus sp. 2789STDY5834896]|uniref:Protein translocase subunit SecA n=1 Tax=uncultured Anaerotruncus sp. TaxID=905011 RepID=A0A1C6IP62_9FIRM|nr:preprotein translocase subunit SecA [uncultured Anaerotruncus sp.]
MGLKEMLFGSYSKKELKRVDPIAKKVFALEDTYRAYSDAQLRETTQKLKDRLAAGETLDDILPDAFACCREAADRVLGMRHFPVQVIGGIVLHQGRIAEMKTGEGKTLVATLPAYLNALAGKGVHIVTVNDYLAKRDSEWMGKVYRFLGLSVGLIVNGMDNAQRREAYGCDITYGTNNELGFDYLRDNMVIYKENKVQRGHNFAIVDEVDSILIDEARTPLIISGQGDKSTEMYKIADQFAKSLRMTKVAELNDKEDNDEIEGDYIVDEKAKTATLTKEGIKKAEKYFNIENLNDAENMEIAHHINQAIRARGIMVRDVDYVVKDGEVIIVDEFTGRLMIGRRFNEGLHQAIEAKEGVKVLRESKTLATITFQNYFRMYQKLSGMTGTALTEQVEFTEIYKLDVIEIPTNRPNVRQDHNDRIYKTEAAKFRAVIEQIVESHKKGQPVLVGTISIEKSEHLSSLLKKQGIKHEVLNAKYHEKEAEIVAQAGQKGAVTIATNMAGRGTDIVLGGNAEFMAKTEMRRQGYAEELIAESTGHSETEDEEILAARKTFAELEEKYREQIRQDAEAVKEAGGLFIIGTERHESRRIDNQLRGRAGRQGDPGETIFFLSLEDDLMRLFGGERVQNMMGSLGLEEDQPIEMKVLTNAIESAQRKVEGRNFGIRKNVLRYDDVMNKQREIIYAQRDKVLNGEDVHQNIVTMLEDTVQSAVSSYIAADSDPSEWNIKGLKSHYLGWILDEDDLHYTEKELADLTPDKLREIIIEKAKALYAAKEELYGAKIMRELERVVLLRVVDTKWMDHIDAMEELKQGIYLRSYAQKDPAVEYQIEGFDMFDELIESIKEDTVKMVLTMVIKTQEEPKREQVAKPAAASAGSGDGTAKKEPVRKKKIGRNDPCPCGSGKKYKKCCGRDL